MKKILCFIAVALMGMATIFSQTVTLTFTARDAANHYVQLNRVTITNLTKSWQETIYWPDTTLTMQNGTGIDEFVDNGGFALTQNNPNPFSGTTDVNLTVTDAGAVTLEIVDGNGKMVGMHRVRPEIGTHQFRVSLSTAGTYVMTARQNGKTSSIKMVCNGGGNANGINYLGMVQTITYVLKSTTNNPFNFGDMMEYVGFATINGTEVESQRITQAQGASQTFVLQFEMTQLYAPLVTTASVSDITAVSATCGGNVTSDGGATVTARGVCWSTSQNPTVSGSHSTNGTGTGSYISSLTSLTPNTIYYARAYATNSVGTAYGNEVSFSTPTTAVGNDGQPCPGTPTLTDIDGNVYNTVQIGNQCWMKENLRTTKYADGTSIALGSNTSTTTAYRYYPNNNSSNVSTYGYLYNWKAVMGNSSSSSVNPSGVQGICPNGWHVPSDAEWTQLTNYVSSQSQYVCGGDNTYIAKALASTTGWNSSPNTCAVGNNPTSNNATGFSALPAGSYEYGDYTGFGGGAIFWSATEGSASGAYYRLFSNNNAEVYRHYGYGYKYNGFSARCVFVLGGTLPTVTTTAISNLTATTATCGGNVFSDGGETVTARGVCWSTSQNPTISDSHTSDGTGTGSFTSSLTSLTAGTTYYVRAYATNSIGTAYGDEVSFTANNIGNDCTPLNEDFENGIPSTWLVVDYDGDGYNWSSSSDIMGTGAGFNGSDGCATSQSYDNSQGALYPDNWLITPHITLPISATLTFWVCAQDANYAAEHYGVYISTTGHTTTGSFTLLFEETLDANGGVRTQGAWKKKTVDLSAYAGYTVRIAFRHFNCADRFYINLDNVTITCSDSVTQDGQPCPEAATLTDVDGNTYNTVQIGNQCWMKENLRTTKYADGTSIALGSNTSTTTAYRYYPNNNSSNVSTYGYLYNWKAVMGNSSSSSVNPSGVQGICPNGWHVPSDAEWTQLTNYVSSHSQYVCGGDNTYIAKALASTTGWNSSSNTCAVGNNPTSNNATGFSALPAGRYYNGNHVNFGYEVFFWSATENYDNAYYRMLLYNYAFVANSIDYKDNGFSVRCLRNESGSSTTQLPTVTTSSISNVAETSASCGGNVTSDGGASVTARGVCWSTSQTPTTSSSHTTDGIGTGSFTSSITGLSANTTYYVRAYATNSVGTAYGNEVSFTTNSSTAQDGQPCPGAATVTDIDNNVYNTVQIGNQCWMKENLRTTRYANGTWIALATTTTGSTTTAYRYDYNHYDLSGAPTEVSTYGYLYNWKAVMGNSSSSSANPSGVQGICPTGWHVPSDAEWTQLTDYVSSQSRYVCGDDNTQIAKALASNSHWREISELGTCKVGSPQQTYPYDLGNNNATGFSALPAGYFYSGGGQGCNYHSQVARFWSATKPVGSIAARHLDYNTAIVTRLELNGESSPFWGCSVRCLRNESGSSTPQSPIVYTSTASNITGTTVTCGGNVTSNGGSPVTAYGVCWSTSHNPTVNNSHTTDGSGMGSFTSNVTGLTANTTYYVRAYATNNIDTAYGNEVSFTAHNCGTSTLTDIDGNTYNTVQIGNQCWMKENLRTTRYANGTNITLVSSGNGSSNTIAFRYYPYGTSSNVSTYGYLYNWGAVKGPFSNNQGVCPNGWHVPSDAEWTQLTDYVSSQSQYVCGGDNTYIANALASTTGWNSCSSTCMPGNTPSSNNATGFSALPAGGYNGSYDNIGHAAIFWSSTENNNDYAKYRQINNCLSVVLGDGLNSEPKSNGYSVRCLRN